jgi:hypothetical protein
LKRCTYRRSRAARSSASFASWYASRSCKRRIVSAFCFQNSGVSFVLFFFAIFLEEIEHPVELSIRVEKRSNDSDDILAVQKGLYAQIIWTSAPQEPLLGALRVVHAPDVAERVADLADRAARP